ncbi:MAG: hypothetical protein AABX14_01075 [Candidatus Aenigmatarchaeota archaeon]
MTNVAIKKLREFPLTNLRTVATEFAHTRKRSAVKELIRMADGRRRRGLQWYERDSNHRNLRYVKNYGEPQCYETDPQLISIDALGESHSGLALAYLCRLLKTRKYIYSESYGQGGDIEGYRTILGVNFPNARKTLRNTLNLSLEVPDDTTSNNEEVSKQAMESNEAYRKICAAVKKLEAEGVVEERPLFFGVRRSFLDAYEKCFRATLKTLSYPVVGNLSWNIQKRMEERYSWYNGEKASIASVFTNIPLFTVAGYGLASTFIPEIEYTDPQQIDFNGFFNAMGGAAGFALACSEFQSRLSGRDPKASVIGKIISYPIEFMLKP